MRAVALLFLLASCGKAPIQVQTLPSELICPRPFEIKTLMSDAGEVRAIISKDGRMWIIQSLEDFERSMVALLQIKSHLTKQGLQQTPANG